MVTPTTKDIEKVPRFLILSFDTVTHPFADDTEVESQLLSYSNMIAVEGAATSDNAVAITAYADPDTMQWREARRKPNRDDFKRADQEEWNGQYGNENFSIIHKMEIPEGGIVLPGVWAMRCKRIIKTSRVKKHKARWNWTTAT